MARMNYRNAYYRDRMRRYGAEPAGGDNPATVAMIMRRTAWSGSQAAQKPLESRPRQPRRRPKATKAELRRQAAAAFLAWRERQDDPSDG